MKSLLPQALAKAKAKAEEAKKKLKAAQDEEVEDEKMEEAGEAKKEDEEEDEKEEEAKEEEKEEEKSDSDPEPPTAELTEEEKELWFRPKVVPDLASAVLSKAFPHFSVPSKSEGFDDVTFEWQGESKCKKYIQKWVADRKLTAPVEDLVAGKWFKEKSAAWKQTIEQWRQKQVEFNESKAKGAGAKPAEEDENQVDDIFSLEDVCDVGGNEGPLFAKFGLEDWALVMMRCDFFLLINAFGKDCGDTSRPIHETNLPLYYSKYFGGKKIQPVHYGFKELKEVMNLIKDTVDIKADTRIVTSTVSEDADDPSMFVKLAEECRRERQRRHDAGDVNAKLKFQPAVMPPMPKKGKK